MPSKTTAMKRTPTKAPARKRTGSQSQAAQNNQKRNSVIAILVILAVIAAVLLAGGGSKDIPPDIPGGCTTEVYFYANDAPAGSNRFGPELTDPSLEAGVNRFDTKLCTDPVFTAVWEDIILYDLANGTPEWYDARANQFIADRGEWKRAVRAINETIDSFEVEDRSESYHTLLMEPRGLATPLVRQTDRPVAMGRVLVIHLKNGRTEFARYVCDLQPARPGFPGIPPVGKCVGDCVPVVEVKCQGVPQHDDDSDPFCGKPHNDGIKQPPEDTHGNQPDPPPPNPPPAGAPDPEEGTGPVVVDPPDEPATPPTTSEPRGDPCDADPDSCFP